MSLYRRISHVGIPLAIMAGCGPQKTTELPSSPNNRRTFIEDSPGNLEACVGTMTIVTATSQAIADKCSDVVARCQEMVKNPATDEYLRCITYPFYTTTFGFSSDPRCEWGNTACIRKTIEKEVNQEKARCDAIIAQHPVIGQFMTCRNEIMECTKTNIVTAPCGNRVQTPPAFFPQIP